MKLYHIKDWDTRYENNRSREMETMRWVPIPRKFDGDGYTALISGPAGVSVYGAWVAILLVAGGCDPRGTLVRSNGTPHDAQSLSRITHIQERWFNVLFERASDPSVGWLLVTESQAGDVSPAPNPQAGDVQNAPDRRMNGMEWSGREDPPFPPELSGEGFADAWGRWTQHRREIRSPVTPTSARQSIKKLAAWGLARATAAIDHSIANGWRGIFEADGKRQPVKVALPKAGAQ